ncbi:FixJ family two-component response regulator [Rhizobium sp. BK181]|uniref:response regulator transcription factor n=1 Tax=Rhizobium sp. BK181 TaxID=2587072 RepID=UPI001841D7A8|nr:response regulator [Rhizobium sp. BK181]MBB3314624.1 FixJ family two-component response regulator [Rhizobium sp. BK181]
MIPQDTPVVFVVDDDISVRDALEALIRSAGWHPISFENAEQFLTLPSWAGPSCLVLDVNLPNLDGLELQEYVSRHQVTLPIIFLTGYGDIPTTVRAMKAGAVEFLTKPVDGEVMLEAMKQALLTSRKSIASEEELQLLRGRHTALSHREQEVMALIVAGLLNKQVAYELGISEVTVKVHRARVMSKMGARSLPDLVLMAARLGVERTVRHSEPASKDRPAAN